MGSAAKEPDGKRLPMTGEDVEDNQVKDVKANSKDNEAAVVSPPPSPNPIKGNVQVKNPSQFKPVDLESKKQRDDTTTTTSAGEGDGEGEGEEDITNKNNTDYTNLDTEWHSGEANLDTKRELPEGWTPTPDSVICGRGKECFEAEGNKRFREIINSYLKEYMTAPGKSEKSRIVTRAMNIIRKASPEGSFVKFEKGKWYEVSLRYAREKVGAWFRDCLSHRYKSSSKAKHARKMAKRVSVEYLVDPDAVFNFPPNFAAQIQAHEQQMAFAATCSQVQMHSHMQAHHAQAQAQVQPSSSLELQQQAFYDIDDLSLIPFDRLEP